MAANGVIHYLIFCEKHRCVGGVRYFCEWSVRPTSPYINHFISADTIVPGYTNPQNLNRYSYVANNPLRYIDPTGHSLLENEYGGGCSTSGYCGGSGNSNNTNPNNNKNDDDNNNSGGGGAHTGGSGSSQTPTPSTTPAPQLPPLPSPQGTPFPSLTVVSQSVTQQTSYTYTQWSEGPYGDDGVDIGFSINPLFFLSAGPLEANVSQGDQALQITIDTEYRYVVETTTTTMTTTTTIVDQYGNNMSSTTNTNTTSDTTGIYQQAQTTVLPAEWTFTETGGNMCGTMLPC